MGLCKCCRPCNIYRRLTEHRFVLDRLTSTTLRDCEACEGLCPNLCARLDLGRREDGVGLELGPRLNAERGFVPSIL